jgi:O-succinylbenzoate synthase
VRLAWRPFELQLPQPLATARGTIRRKRGWLLRLEGTDGAVGWGEVAPLDGELAPLRAALAELGSAAGPGAPWLERAALEERLMAGGWPGSLAFALGAALAELDGLPRGRWLPAPASAVLLPAGAAALTALRQWRAAAGPSGTQGPAPLRCPPTFKWKVAVVPDREERALLEQLLEVLSVDGRLRLDANGGWDRPTAWQWAERLAAEPRLAWLEQPLAPGDHAGLCELADRVPVALDESLQVDPALAASWSGWQVRRPSQEGDPRPLLAALEAGRPRLMLSTAFETGIGRRWLQHLAALQAEGPTPAAPGLAPGWQPCGGLASADPEAVWEAAAVAMGPGALAR